MLETVLTSVMDQFQAIRRHKSKLTLATCTVFFILGLALCTRVSSLTISLFRPRVIGVPLLHVISQYDISHWTDSSYDIVAFFGFFVHNCSLLYLIIYTYICVCFRADLTCYN